VPKFIGIDFGLKRIGVAITDELNIIASPYDTVETNNIYIFLKELLGNENIKKLIIGNPINLDNSLNPISKEISDFTKSFLSLYSDVEIIHIDERFTSKMAKRAILASGVNKKRRQDKKLVDKISATIILQTYLNQL
jgi:putative Holliday junction resolvase|tara:strand:- start:2838 stop:3248 length:411 start_codon:yes stop_codon:yes gene_type:complete